MRNEKETLEKINLHKGRIFELVEKIENPAILMKIYTVVKTHYEILMEKEQEG